MHVIIVICKACFTIDFKSVLNCFAFYEAVRLHRALSSIG